MMAAVWVAIGGAAGSLARYGFGLAAARLLGTGFPWGTLIVNATGGLAIGVLAARLGPQPSAAWTTIGVGVLGGFTTFSAFSLEAVRLMQHQPGVATLYVAASLALSLGACWLGLGLGRL